MDKDFYFNRLYPFQDKILRIIDKIETGFYLTGGTASSRAYLQHRFSDDLDFFVNDNDQFSIWAERIIHALTQQDNLTINILHKEDRFIRLTLLENNILLKLEFVNDVPSHIGEIRKHEILGRLDSPENILANKITAVIDREEPKDLADIWGFCCKMGLSIITAITDAHSKAAGIFPADLARVLCSVTLADCETVRWIEKPDCEQFLTDLRKLGESLIV